jgi:hypothetical protein
MLSTARLCIAAWTHPTWSQQLREGGERARRGVPRSNPLALCTARKPAVAVSARTRSQV